MAFKTSLTLLYLLHMAVNVNGLAAISSCRDILTRHPRSPSGVYVLNEENGGSESSEEDTRIVAYCEMGLNGGGYTFLSPKALTRLTNWQLQNMFMDRTSIILRERKCDGSQPYSVLSQLPEYSSTPLYLALNSYGTSIYTSPLNVRYLGEPYLYVGFVPTGNIRAGRVQGLTSNGRHLRFTNCDATSNSYIALFTDFKERNPTSHAASGLIIDQLLGSAVKNPSRRVMPLEYFLFMETHWGGCGGYAQTDDKMAASKCILGAAIGFR